MAAADTRASTLLRVELEEVKEELTVTQGHLAKQLAEMAAENGAEETAEDESGRPVSEFGSGMRDAGEVDEPIWGVDGRRPLPGSAEPASGSASACQPPSPAPGTQVTSASLL